MARVTIRKKGISKNRHCLYLDYYPPVRNPKTGKLHRFEFLKVYTFDKPGTSLERKHNQETMELVENVRAQRQIDIQNEKFAFISSDMRKGNFVEFFKAYINSKTRSECDNLAMSHRYFVEFAGDVLYFNELTDYLCEDYKHFLLSGPGIGHRQKPITKNTAVNYFAKFRSALKQAYKRELIAVDLYSQVEPIDPKETLRERLEIEEFQLLANTPVKSDLVKRAALFAGLTGLRFSDVASLKWSEVRGSAGKYTLQFTQEKTAGAVVLPVSDQAIELIGERSLPEDKVFKGLRYSNMRDVFKLWLQDAGITKNITFHSFRHTFATLQLELGTDLYTVSKMLGHKSIKTTQIYAKVVDKKKVEAAGRIKLDLESLKVND